MILTALFASGQRTREAQVAQTLRSVPLFRDVPGAELLAIRRRLQVLRAPAGTVICERGEPGDCLYMVQTGALEIRLGLGPSGIVIRHSGPGDFLGEAALLAGAPCSADVVVVEDAVLWMLARQDFETALAGSVSLVRAVNRALCERVGLLTQILEERGAGMGHTLEGTRFGPYLVVEQAGAGGMAVVYSAVHVESGRAAALKLLPPGWSAAPELRARLVREAMALRALDHPHVVKVLDVGEVDACLGGGPFLAMEWLPHALDRLLRAQHPARLAPSQALHMAQQIAEGLQAVHAAGLVHRDVKPSNIMLRADGTPVLIDFGLAGLITAGTGVERLTATNVFMGTVGYLAPEIVQGADATPGSDLYALGVVLYELLAGALPFARCTPLGVLRAHVEDAPPPLPPDVPDAARAVAERALRKCPAQRYASAAEMARALAGARAQVDN